MKASAAMATPSGHTTDGGVLVGDPKAGAGLILFEDPQCPYCREFEEVNAAVDHGRADGRRAGRRISHALLPRTGVGAG